MKALFICDLEGWNGSAKLYQVDPPVDYNGGKTEYVIVSAVNAMFSGPETYIFPANENGDPINYRELDGSFRGELNHEKALANAGYSIK